jgi:UDP-3-O-[3-hydroxymyristoyl] glucosamine N-acyltransferase
MSNKFNRCIEIQELAVNLNFVSPKGITTPLVCISEPELTEDNSLCLFIKGTLPEPKKNLVLVVKESIEGYQCIISPDPKTLLVDIIKYVEGTVGFFERYKNAVLSNTVNIGKNVVIEDNVEIGEGTIIEHNVVIYSGSKIGKNCVIRSNTSIGCQSYNYYPNASGHLVAFPAIGGVNIKDDVEIGSNCSVAKGIITDTLINERVKVDNQVNVAHDCVIGADATITAGVTFCGYVTVGERTRIAPQATIRQRLTIGSDATVGLGAVVIKSVSKNTTVAGNPAKPLKQNK